MSSQPPKEASLLNARLLQLSRREWELHIKWSEARSEIRKSTRYEYTRQYVDLMDVEKLRTAIARWTTALVDISRDLDELAEQGSFLERTHVGPPPAAPGPEVPQEAQTGRDTPASSASAAPGERPGEPRESKDLRDSTSHDRPTADRTHALAAGPDESTDFLRRVDDSIQSSTVLPPAPVAREEAAGEPDNVRATEKAGDDLGTSLETSRLREELVDLCDLDDDALLARLRARHVSPTRPMFKKGPHRCVPVGEGRSVFSLVFPHRSVLTPQVRFFEMLFGRGHEGRKFRVTRLPVIAADRDDYHLSEDIVRPGSVRSEG